ncbi:hypothetical protein JCM3774_000750 [Rhodotorula dairenensis]
MGYFGGVTKPFAPRHVDNWKKHAETGVLSAIVCLRNEDGTAGQAIGVVDLEKREMGGPQNRCCGFGIVINKQYSGMGYATEAMEWILRRAFIGYNMHRVEGGVFSWNTAALRTYEKVGLVEEGRRRKAVWEEGQWHDDVTVYVAILAFVSMQRSAFLTFLTLVRSALSSFSSGILAEEWFARHPDSVQRSE